VSTYELIRQAILEKKQIVATYKGLRREMCPHVLGTKEGRPQAHFFQFGGESSSPLRSEGGWRCIELQHLEDVQLRDGIWHTADTGGGRTSCVDTIDVEAS
jgi:hypothetical protein